jgi:hypothetical protein
MSEAVRRHAVVPRTRRALVAGLCAALGVSLLGTTSTGPAAAATALPSWAAELHLDPSLADPWEVAQAGGRVFVSDGNSVHAYEKSGATISTIEPVWGARDMVSSTAGSRLLVAQNDMNTITSIDTKTLGVAATYAVAPCPQRLAVSGTLLFYSYGCAGAGGINHVDLATGEVHDLASPDVAGIADGVPRLGAGGGSLYAVDSSGVLHGWPVTASGLGTERSVYLGQPGARRFEVRGTTIALVGAGVTLVDGTSLVTRGTVGTATSTVIGLSPDGTRAVYADTSTPMTVVDTAAGTQKGTVLLPATTRSYDVNDGRVAFSPDGTLMYWLVGNYLGGVHSYALVVGSPYLPPQLAVTLSVHPKAGPDYTSVLVTGTPNRTVRVTIRNPNGSIERGDVVLNATGRYYFRMQRRWTGTIVAEILGDATHRAAKTPTTPLNVPVRIRLSPNAAYKTVGGVLYYRQPVSARQSIYLSTARPGRYLRATLWRWTGTRWIVVLTQPIPLSDTGRATTVMASAVRGVRYRLTFVFPGDRYNATSKATSLPFVIG